MIPQRQCTICGFVIALLVSCVGGCAGFENSPFLNRHFSNRQKSTEAAQARWNDVRGDVRRQMAKDQLKAGNVAEAERLIGESLSMSPDDAEGLRLQARVCLLQDKLDIAAQAAHRAVTLDEQHAEGHLLVGAIAERRGETDKCLSAYRRATELDGDELGYALALIRALVGAGRESEAARMIAAQCDRFPQSAELHLLGMDLARQAGQREIAVRYARALSRFASDDVDAAARAGVVLSWAGDHQTAVVLLRAVVKQKEKDDVSSAPMVFARPLVVRSYARSCAELGDFDMALTALKPILRDDPGDTVAWSLFCRVALSAGDLKTAQEAVHTFNQRNVADADMLLLEGIVCFHLGQRGRTMQLADAAVRADPSCADAARELRARAGDLDASKPAVVFFSSAKSDPAAATGNELPLPGEVRRR